MRVEGQNAFVLKSQSYLENSLLVDIFSREYGRLKLVVKGAKSGKSTKASRLQPFSELVLNWQGKSDLKNLGSIDSNAIHLSEPSRLVYGMYLNELLFFLLGEMDAHPLLYDLYLQSLGYLNQTDEVEPVLRNFEFCLLDELGYAVDFSQDSECRKLIDSRFYQYQADIGFICIDNRVKGAIPGDAIIKLAQEGLVTPLALKAAKLICRTQINLLLNGRELQSRKWHTSSKK